MIDWCYHNLAVVSASCYLVEIGAIITLLLFLLAATDFAADINGLTAVVATDYITISMDLTMLCYCVYDTRFINNT